MLKTEENNDGDCEDARLLSEPMSEPSVQTDPAAAVELLAQASASPATPKQIKIEFLDGLRGLAAMLVVATHAEYIKDHNMGPPAVDMFFVLSAFLLTLLFETKARELLRQKASYKQWGRTLAEYFVRRFLRVYPLFAIVATVLAVLSPKERTRSLRMKHPNDYQLLQVLRFKQHPHIFWTLPIEISYYVLIPALVVVGLQLGRAWWLLPIVGYPLVFHNGLYEWGVRMQHNSLRPHYPTLLCGSLAAMIYSRLSLVLTSRQFVFRAWHTVLLRVIQLAFLVLLLSDMFNGLLFTYVVANPFPDSIYFVSFPLTVLIVCEMLQRGPLSSLLEWSLLRHAGKVSFSMYLLHIFVVYADFLNHASYWNRVFMLWTLVFLVSTVSFYAVEQPCQRLSARIGKKLEGEDRFLPTTATKATQTPKPAKAH